MADTRDLLVRILGDDRSLQAAFTRTERRTKQFETRTSRLGAGLTRAFAAAGVTLGASFAIANARKLADSASDLNEEISKSRVIFGEASAEIEEWSKTTASSIGVARVEALQATGQFGNLFRVLDLAPEKSADLSKSLVQLAADMASLNNADPTDVLVSLRSGLVGEAEPLRKYSVFLTEARVQQQAMADTGKKNVKELTNQEKILARYKIILEDTIPAQGDFARTANESANRTRRLNAEAKDLGVNLGQVLKPGVDVVTISLLGLVDGTNLAIQGMKDLQQAIDDLDFDAFKLPGSDIGGSFAGLFGLRERIFGEDEAPVGPSTRPDVHAAGERGTTAEDVKRETEKREQEARELQRALRDSRRRFEAFTKGLGLKFERAGLTASLDDDIAALDELERAILRQIQREGRTFKLVELLTRTRAQKASLVEQQAAESAERARRAFQEIIDGLDLKLQQALSTPGFKDDLRALRNLENAIKERIQAEGRTVDLLRQLNDIREQRRQVLEDQREQQRERRQGRQFEALGLTATGEQRTPSTGALRRRLGNLREQLKGTALDTEQTRTQLQRIAKVLSGQFGKVGEDVRKAILEMFRNISDALKSGDRSAAAGGEITPGGIKQIDNLVKGLGLTDEQIAAIHARNQQIRRRPRSSAFGFGLGGDTGTRGTGGRIPHGAARDEVNIFLTVELDGKEVANSTIRHAQKRGNRRAPARRGRHGGRNLGLG